MNARMLARMSSTDGAFCGCRREKPESCMSKKRRRMHVPAKGIVMACEKPKRQGERAKRLCWIAIRREWRRGDVAYLSCEDPSDTGALPEHSLRNVGQLI